MKLDRVLQVLGVGEGRRDRQPVSSPAPGVPAVAESAGLIVEELQARTSISERPKASDSVLHVTTHDRFPFIFSDYHPPSGGYAQPER